MIAPAPADFEGAPETLSFRHLLRRVWAALGERFATASTSADPLRTPKATTGSARKQAAARALRGELRSLMTQLFTFAPAPAIVRFLAAAPTWGESGEHLLDRHSAAVVELIDSVYPVPSLHSVEPLDPVAANDNERWVQWLAIWSEELIAVDPESRQHLRDSGLARPSTLRRWAPWVAGGVVILGSVALILRTKRRAEAERVSFERYSQAASALGAHARAGSEEHPERLSPMTEPHNHGGETSPPSPPDNSREEA